VASELILVAAEELLLGDIVVVIVIVDVTGAIQITHSDGCNIHWSLVIIVSVNNIAKITQENGEINRNLFTSITDNTSH